MSKQWFTRLARIASGNFGAGKEDGFSLVASLTKFERFVHFWVLVGRSFVRNRCPVRAAALSYTTLLALIPMLAVVMSVASIVLKETGKERIRAFIETFVDSMVPTIATTTPGAGPVYVPTTFTNNFDEFNLDEDLLRQAWAAMPGSSNEPPILTLDSPELGGATNSPGQTNAPASVAAETEVGVAQVKENVSTSTADYIYSFVENMYSGTLGVTGMLLLLLTAILTLTRVEETFNDIWGVTRGRDWWSRIANYFTTIAVGPVLILSAIGLANGPNFEKTRQLLEAVPFLQPLVSSILPVAVVCFAFALLYKLVPNTRVDFSAALIGGTLAGVAWHIYNELGFLLASQAVQANAVYGSLFVVPLLMGGLYIGWLTILFGAQVAYAFQNRESYLQERLAENVNQRGREFVALRLMTYIGQRFHEGLPPVTIRDISKELGVPGKLAQQVMRTLLTAGLVVEVGGTEAGYSPARPLDAINCHHILLAMRAAHGQEPATRDEPVRAEVLGEFARIQAAEEHAAGAVSMLALVTRAQARLQLAAAPESKPVPPPTPLVVAIAATAGAAPLVPAENVVADAAEIDFEVAEPEPDSSAAPSELVAASQAVAAPESLAPNSPVVRNSPNENESFPL
jgi:membrane protein